MEEDGPETDPLYLRQFCSALFKLSSQTSYNAIPDLVMYCLFYPETMTNEYNDIDITFICKLIRIDLLGCRREKSRSILNA